MTDQTDIEGGHHQQQRSVVVPVAGAGRGVEHLVAEGVVAAGFARAMWSEWVAVADLRFSLATVESEQRGDRAPESGGVRRVTVTGLRVPDPQFPPSPPQLASGGAAQGRWLLAVAVGSTCTVGPGSRASGRCGGGAPPPRATPGRYAGAFFPWRDSLSPTARRGRYA